MEDPFHQETAVELMSHEHLVNFSQAKWKAVFLINLQNELFL